MLTQQARSKGRSGGYRSLHSDGGARLPDGSIDYALYKLRARQLQRAFLAAMVSAARQRLVRALTAAAATIGQWAPKEETRQIESRRAA